MSHLQPEVRNVTSVIKGVDSQDYWGDIKEDWGSGRQKFPSGLQGRSPGMGSRGRSPPEAEAFL